MVDDRTLIWWKKVLRLLLAFLLFVGVAILIGLLLNLIYDATLSHLVFDTAIPVNLLIGWTMVLVSSLFSVWLQDRLSVSLGWRGLGFGRHRLWEGIRLGGLVGGGIILLCFIVLLSGDWVRINAMNFDYLPFIGWLVFFIIQPLAEEVVMRSFLQNQVHRYFGTYAGLGVTALVFAAMHMGNNSFSWIAGLEILLGGYLIGQLYLKTQNIWAPFAMHAAWNFMQSTVLGFAVSGSETYHLLSLDIQGPTWLTGGDFGLEGSILSLIALAISITYFHNKHTHETPWEKEKKEVVKKIPQ